MRLLPAVKAEGAAAAAEDVLRHPQPVAQRQHRVLAVCGGHGRHRRAALVTGQAWREGQAGRKARRGGGGWRGAGRPGALSSSTAQQQATACGLWRGRGRGHLAPGTTTAGAGRPQTSALQTLHTCTARVQERLGPGAEGSRAGSYGQPHRLEKQTGSAPAAAGHNLSVGSSQAGEQGGWECAGRVLTAACAGCLQRPQ